MMLCISPRNRSAMSTLTADIRFAFRQMLRWPGVTATALLSIALGIGAATAIFSVIHAVILDPFPYRDVDSLMSVAVREPSGRGVRTGYTIDQFLEIQARSRVFSAVTVSTISNVLWTGKGDPEQLRGNHTTFGGLALMGVPALVGRIFDVPDGAGHAESVCVLGYRYWQKRFGGDPGVVGRTMLLNGKARTVLGVMPPRFMWRGADVYLPLQFRQGEQPEGVRFLHLVGRVKPGISPAAAEADLRPILEDLRTREPGSFPAQFKVSLLPFAETFPSGIKQGLWLLLAAVGLLLLIACANVSSLLMARGLARGAEMAVRLSVGAKRFRLIRQLLTESFVLAATGGIFGIALAFIGLRAILAVVPPNSIPDESHVRIHLPVLLFSFTATLLTAVIFGLGPALAASRANLAVVMRAGGRGAIAGRGHALVRGALVVAEVALAVVLLTSAGLMIRTLQTIQSADLGVRTDQLLSLRIPLSETRYPTSQQRAAVVESLLDRLEGAPGIELAAVNTWWHPLGNFSVPVRLPSQTQPDNRRVTVHPVSSRYLQLYAIPIKTGRGLTRADVAQRRQVVVVSQRLVQRFFPGKNPLGQVLAIPALKEPPMKLPDDRFEIVGVAGDTAGGGLQDERPELYFPHTLVGLSDCLSVRATTPDPLSALPTLRAAMATIDPNQPFADIQTIEGRLSTQMLSGRRFNAILFGVFAGLGLTLALIGIYGVISNSVSRRRNEIGVRMAMGAAPGAIVGQVLREGARLLLLGVGIGTLAALATSRVLTNLVWRAQVFDPLTMALVAALLLATGLAATWLPARRAGRLDPMNALRYD